MDIIDDLCQSLSLSQDEDDIVTCDLSKSARVASEKKVANSLIGKIMSTKRVSREGVIQTVNFLWRTKEPMIVESVGINLFVFHFRSQEDRRRVMAGSPWNYQEHLIAPEIPVGLGDYQSMNFDFVPFWVQIHNLPLMCLSKEAGMSLGSQIGKVIEVDPGATGDCTGKYIRVRVIINIAKPLKRGLKVNIDEKGNNILAMLKYERLPELCLSCGIIGHLLPECSRKKGDGAPFKYSDTIRAGLIQRYGGHSKRIRTDMSKNGLSGEELNHRHRHTLPAEKSVDVPGKEVGEKSGEEKGISNLVTAYEKISPVIFSSTIKENKDLITADLVEIEIDKDFEQSGGDILAHIKEKFNANEESRAGLGVRARTKGF